MEGKRKAPRRPGLIIPRRASTSSASTKPSSTSFHKAKRTDKIEDKAHKLPVAPTIARNHLQPAGDKQVNTEKPLKKPRAKRTLIPKLSLAKVKKLHIGQKPVFLSAIGVMALAGASFGVKAIMDRKNTQVEGVSVEAIEVKPRVVPALSDGVSQEELKFDDYKGTVSIKDTFNDVSLTMTQQALPDDFKSNPEKLAIAAASVGAKAKFNTSNGVAYLATADGADSVGQWVVYATDRLLIFINAPSNFSASKWAEYLDSLKETAQ